MNSSEFQKILTYRFRKPELLARALTHSSFNGSQEEYQEENYEKLEFLGDAFLDAVVSQWLIQEHPDMKEGDLSKTRALIVCEKSLARIALQLGIAPFIRMSRGEEITGGRDRPSILADTVEAVIGAIFLDGGYDAVRDFILNTFRETFREALQDGGKKDFKTQLQELLQYEADLAEKFFAEAEEEYNRLSPEDRAALVPAQAMALIYHTILDKMKAGGFRIFDIRYRVNTFHKLWLLFRTKLDIDPQSYYDKSKAYYDKLVGFLSRPGRKDEK